MSNIIISHADPNGKDDEQTGNKSIKSEMICGKKITYKPKQGENHVLSCNRK